MTLSISVREADPSERRQIRARWAYGEPLGSDACIAVLVDDKIVGWGDDYGSFHQLPAPTDGVEAAGEVLLKAAVGFWEAQA